MAIHFTGLRVWQDSLREKILLGNTFYGRMSEEPVWRYKWQDSVFGKTVYGTSCLAIHFTGLLVWRYILRVNMFISFLAGDSIIIGVGSDGAVGKAADSHSQNHGTVPGVIRIFAHSSLFGDTKGEVCLARQFTGLPDWQDSLRGLFGDTFYGVCLAIHFTGFVWQDSLRDFVFGNTFDGVRLPG